MTTRPRKQEQEPASSTVEEAARGVLRMQLPVHLPGLGHVNMYALEDERGVAVVDPGLPGKASWRAMEERLRDAGIPLGRVHTVLITHSHPDHFGGAGRLAHETGAEVVTHAAFRTWTRRPHRHADHDPDVVTDGDGHDPEAPPPPTGPPWSRPAPWGGRSYKPPLRRRVVWGLARAVSKRHVAPPEPTRRVRDGDVIRLAGRDWFAVHTPGHTLDHLCLVDPEERVLLSGDHVLPTITPHISGMDTGDDPLAAFLASLDKVADLDGVERVLPAHGHPFADLPGRVEEIKEHHMERLERLRTTSADVGPATVEELSHHLFRPRSWGPMATSETYAHLEHLRLAGRAERWEEKGLLVYRVG